MATTSLESVLQTFAEAESIWLITVRADGRPHGVPIWFVWYEGAAWVYSSAQTVHVRSMRRNPAVQLNTPETHETILIEGNAEVIDGVAHADARALAPLFLAKHGLDVFVEAERGPTVFVRIAPVVVKSWGKAGTARWILRDGAWVRDEKFKPF